MLEIITIFKRNCERNDITIHETFEQECTYEREREKDDVLSIQILI